MKDHSNVQVQNRTTKSRGSAYTLSNGQRVPVLFRLTNVQMPKTAVKNTDTKPEASIRIDAASSGMTANLEKADAMSISEPTNTNDKMVGPSWMRRYAYRLTVLVLLIATVLLLNNNRGKAVRPLDVASTDSKPTKDLASSEVAVEAASDVTTQTKSDIEIAAVEPTGTPTATVEAETDTPQSPTVAQQSTTIAQQSASGTRATTLVETTTTDSSTQFLITKESEPSSTEAPAVAQLLTPQILDNSASSKSPFLSGDSSTSVSISAQPVSTGSIGSQKNASVPTSLDSSDARTDTRINRYAGAPVQGTNSTNDNNIPSTNAPPPDPSDLFAVFQQQSQIQPPDETVRAAMRQTTSAMNPAWQAIPVSNTTNATPVTGMNNAIGNANPTGFAPTMQNNLGTPQQNAMQPQQPLINRSVTPVQTQYQPVFPQYGQQGGNLNGSELYTTPSMPVQGPQTTQPAPSAAQPYQPLYPGLTTPSSPGMMGSQLFESADQSASGY